MTGPAGSGPILKLPRGDDMTKNEITAEILSSPLVHKLINTRQTGLLADGTVIYSIEFLEVLEKSATLRAVSIYVLDEGLPSEAAYYRDVEASPAIQTFSDKLKPLLKTYNASIIESGNTWALAETNILIENAGVYTIKKDQYFVVDGDPITITKIG